MKTLSPIFLISLIIVSCISNQTKEGNLLKYEIISKQDKSYMNTSRMTCKVLLDVVSLPTDDEIVRTAKSIWESGYKDWKEFSVSVFLPEINAETFGYAIVNFTDKGFSNFFKYENVLMGTKWAENNIGASAQTEISEARQGLIEDNQTKLKEYSINISIVPAAEKQIKVTIETGFPDGTNLLLSVYRIYYQKGDTTEYSGNLGEVRFSVKEGKYETLISLNDEKWYTEYQDLARSLPNDFPPISKISDIITIDVLYTAATPQPSTVKGILGERGEYVTGIGVGHFGTGTAGRLTTLRASKEYNFPMKGTIKKAQEYADFQSLKVNQTYSVTKETPLMPEFAPSDPMAAMSNIKYLPVGCRIRILSIRTKLNSPWYEVQAINKSGEVIGRGWVNSTALIGQDILVVK